jgi:PAS domain S-box-containing protein
MEDLQWKVLVIDDEEGIRKVLTITLTDAGYEVLTAPDGKAGLRICGEASPQIVITDIRMPGMDGLEVLRRIKQDHPDREVIVITAFGEMEMAVHALQLDASDFITKPIENEALLVALERAKERYRVYRELREHTEMLEARLLHTTAELAKRYDFQSNLIESSMDGIIGCDRAGNIVIFNRSLEKMLGYGKDEVLETLSLDRLFPVGLAEKMKEGLYAETHGGENRLFLYETQLVAKSGERVPVQLSATVLYEEGEESGLVGFFRDLREIRMMEQQFADQTRIIHQHKMMSLGRLAASVVHEINNPLAGILNYIRLMIKIANRGALAREDLEKFQRYLALIEGETDRCSKIVANLLAFSHKSKMEFNEVDANELVQKCIMMSQHKLDLQNIEVDIRLSPEVPKLWADLNQIQQCIINLIFNAIDAMPDGGKLTLASGVFHREGVVAIEVGDNGRGIAAEDLPHIFDPFYTTKTVGEGLGLGLSTVYGIIDRHKGTISVNSDPGKGTVFTIKIPTRT